MLKKINKNQGFSLIELLMVIIVAGILMSMAMQSMTALMSDARKIKTEQELEMLADAIIGKPEIMTNGIRSDFGYVGDIGSFPVNLDGLYQNPGYATWDGPYIENKFQEDLTGFKTDEWGTAYSYSGGTTISSTGSGSTITKIITNATTDYLYNTLNGSIKDANDSLPGSIYKDSVDIKITIPNGAGGLLNKTYHLDALGNFTLDSLPVGKHPLKIIYTPNVDTLKRYVTILPRHKNYHMYRFSSAYFGSSPTTTDTMVLRPDGDGSLNNLTTYNCASNFECVDEITPDEDNSYVIRASANIASETYSCENPSGTPGTIDKITVFCRARRTSNLGNIKPSIFTGGLEDNGTTFNLSDNYTDYSYSWITNPSSGTAWTWTDITNMEIGLALKGKNGSNPSYCTQLWVEVEYTY